MPRNVLCAMSYRFNITRFVSQHWRIDKPSYCYAQSPPSSSKHHLRRKQIQRHHRACYRRFSAYRPM